MSFICPKIFSVLYIACGCVLTLLSLSAAKAATEVGDVHRPELLFGQVMAAYHTNAKLPATPNIVTVRPGKYVIPAVAGKDSSATWSFTNANALKDCTIDLTGVTLVFEGIDGTNLEFRGCKNAVFRGATVYKPVPSFTQGTIVKKEAIDAGHWFEDVLIDAGYLSDPAKLRAKPTVHLFDPKVVDKAGRPLWKANVGYNHASEVKTTETPGKIRLIYTAAKMGTDSAVGDRVVLRGIGNFSFVVSDCVNMTFADLTLGNNGLYGIVEFSGVATKYLRCRITYGPPPPGATVPPIVATSADGLHSLYGNPGPTIESCVIEGTPDDSIAIHGAYGTIGEVLPNNVVALTAKDFRGVQTFAAGDIMRIQGDKTGFYADARVVKVEKIGDVWRCTLDQTMELKPGYRVANPARCGHGYKIIGNTIRRNRARGMLLKADDGLIENNLIEDSSITGIVIAPESDNNEAGYSHDVIIRGNSIRHTGYAENGPFNPQAGGLSVLGNGSIGNRNITIENNVFDRVMGSNLILRATDGITVQRNRFKNTHSENVQNGTRFGIDPAAVINVRDCRHVTLAGNTLDALGRFGKSLIAVDEKTVKDIRGEKDGIRIDKVSSATTAESRVIAVP